MSSHLGLAERVAALHQQLDALGALPTEPDPVRRSTIAPPVEHPRELEHLISQNRRLELLLRDLAPGLADDHTEAPLPQRLAWRTRRLLLRGRQLLGRLREQFESGEVLSAAFAEDLTRILCMTEIALRAVRSFPESTGEQLRLCQGLEALLDLIEKQHTIVRTGLQRRQAAAARVAGLAHFFSALVQGRSALMRPLLELAECLVEEARDSSPIDWHDVDPESPERWVAAHALTVAQVLARIVPETGAAPVSIMNAVVAGLLHDVGMAAMPAELLAQAEPLTAEQRRQIEGHVGLSAEAALRLASDSTWLVAAIRGHHERIDGTGYPAGAQGLQVSPLARLLAVADSYVALASTRPYRPSLAPRAALTETLLEAEKGRLDSAMAEWLLALSFYPVGTSVELSDGSIGDVVAAHPIQGNLALASRPVVSVRLGSDGLPRTAPKYIDLARSTGLHVVRSLPLAPRWGVSAQHEESA